MQPNNNKMPPVYLILPAPLQTPCWPYTKSSPPIFPFSLSPNTVPPLPPRVLPVSSHYKPAPAYNDGHPVSDLQTAPPVPGPWPGPLSTDLARTGRTRPFFYTPGLGCVPIRDSLKRSCPDILSLCNFPMPSANLSCYILSPLYFLLIWSMLIYLVIPCMEIIPYFHRYSYPALDIFQYFQTHFGNGRSQMFEEVKCSHTTDLYTMTLSVLFPVAFDFFFFFFLPELSWCYCRAIHPTPQALLTGNCPLRSRFPLWNEACTPLQLPSRLRWRRGLTFIPGLHKNALFCSSFKSPKPSENISWT